MLNAGNFGAGASLYSVAGGTQKGATSLVSHYSRFVGIDENI